MTMPDERARALIFAVEMMRGMRKAPDILDAWKRQIDVVLRHYPTPEEIQAEARRMAVKDPAFCWLRPWDLDK